MQRIAAFAVGLVFLCSVAHAASRPMVRWSAAKHWARWQVANAVLPPKAGRQPADMKQPAVTAARWQLSKVLGPIINSGTNACMGVVERDLDSSHGRGGFATAVVTSGVIASVVATLAAKELVGRPLARQASRMADAMPPAAKSTAVWLTRAADAMVTKADGALRSLVRRR